MLCSTNLLLANSVCGRSFVTGVTERTTLKERERERWTISLEMRLGFSISLLWRFSLTYYSTYDRHQKTVSRAHQRYFCFCILMDKLIVWIWRILGKIEYSGGKRGEELSFETGTSLPVELVLITLQVLCTSPLSPFVVVFFSPQVVQCYLWCSRSNFHTCIFSSSRFIFNFFLVNNSLSMFCVRDIKIK